MPRTRRDFLTQSSLGWRAEGPDLLTDLKEGGYFS